MTDPIDLDELDQALPLVWYSRNHDPSGPSYDVQEKGLAAVAVLVRSAPALLAAARRLRELEGRVAELEEALAKADEELEQYR